MKSTAITKDQIVDVSLVDISKMDGMDKVTVAVTLEASVIAKLRSKYPGCDLSEEINFILDKKLFEPNPVLKFNGKTKIRSDVLLRLKRISALIQNQPLYPNLKLQQVRAIVKDVLGDFGIELGNSGKHKEAIPYFQKSTELQPNVIEGWINLGNSQKEDGQFPEAIKSYAKALEKDEKSIPALTGLADCYNKLKMFNKSIETLDKILKFEPENAQTWYNKTQVYLITGELHKAKESITQCLEFDPDYPNASFLLDEIKRKLSEI